MYLLKWGFRCVDHGYVWLPLQSELQNSKKRIQGGFRQYICNYVCQDTYLLTYVNKLGKYINFTEYVVAACVSMNMNLKVVFKIVILMPVCIWYF